MLTRDVDGQPLLKLIDLGIAKALNTVTVQPMVDGRLISINFREGQEVKRGDLLAVIDPTTLQAQLDQALAKKAQDEAQLADARRGSWGATLVQLKPKPTTDE